MEYVTAIIILLAGALGILGRWLNLWKQKRTTSTFKQYLMEDFASTMQSGLANLVSSSVMISSLPPSAPMSLVFSIAWGAFGVGYGLDSKLNTIARASIVIDNEQVTTQDIKNAKEVLQDIITDNS
jgi:hypothetical protein